MEAVNKEARNLQTEASKSQQDEEDSEGASAHHLQRRENKTAKKTCYRCGSNDHMATGCPHKDKCCHKCRKMGHLARACKNSKSNSRSRGNTHVLEAGESSDEEDSDEYESRVHKVSGSGRKNQKRRYDKLITTLQVEGKEIQFEVDTGAELSMIPAAQYYSKLRHVELEPSSVILRQYDGTPLPTKGEIVVEVVHGRQKVKHSC